jgi:hypothetical protein
MLIWGGYQMKHISFLVLFMVLGAVIGISGCTTQENKTMKLIAEYNLTSTNNNVTPTKYVTLPEGVKNITVQYNNVSNVDTTSLPIGSGFFQFSTFNVVAREGQPAENYSANAISIKDVNAPANQTLSGNVTLDVNGAKSVGIVCSTAKGNIKVYIS